MRIFNDVVRTICCQLFHKRRLLYVGSHASFPSVQILKD